MEDGYEANQLLAKLARALSFNRTQHRWSGVEWSETKKSVEVRMNGPTMFKILELLWSV